MGKVAGGEWWMRQKVGRGSRQQEGTLMTPFDLLTIHQQRREGG